MGPGERVERYEVVRSLGEGGVARVYLVRHVQLETLHALKVLKLTSQCLQARLQEEGRVQAQLRHENVVHVSDVLQVGEMPALVMEYVEGPDLHRWIREVRPDPALAEQVFRGIVEGLGAAHRAGMVHRDLKPSNVLMSRDREGRLVPKIGDFGLVKVLAARSPSKTRTGIPMGTPEYMAPEQIRDPSRVDHRADLFSLGCILYELLTHRRAYEGPDILSIFQAIEEGRRAPLPPSVPAHLASLVDDCLQAAPERRPADCEAILARLDGSPRTVVGADAPPRRAWSWPRGLWLIAAAPLQLGCLGLACSAWFLPRGAGSAGSIEPCPPSVAPIGWVQVVNEAPPGAAWVAEADVPVLQAPPKGSIAGQGICTLPAGSRVRVVAGPVHTPQGTFLQVRTGLLPEVQTAALAVPEPTPDQPSRDGPCAGEPGERIGWFYTRPHRFTRPPVKGRSWRVSTSKEVLADFPDGPVVCRIEAGMSVKIEQEPVRDGRGYWVPLYAGSVRSRQD